MRKRKAKNAGANLGESLTSLSMQAQLTEPSGWATPTAFSSRGVPDVETWQNRKRRGRPGSTAITELNMQAQLAGWPTATQSDWKRGIRDESRKRKDRRSGGPLLSEAAGWSTPQAGQATAGYAEDKTRRTSTGNRRGHQGNELLRQAGSTGSGSPANGSPAPTAKRGQLNPDLSRWLMGYPVEWLFAAPSNRPSPRFKRKSTGTTEPARSSGSATPSSRKSQPRSSKRRSPRSRTAE